jgi:hypothetical protein
MKHYRTGVNYSTEYNLRDQKMNKKIKNMNKKITDD